MIKILLFISFNFLIISCSFNENSKIWNKQKKINVASNIEKIFYENDVIVNELNPFLKLNLSNIKIKNVNKNNNNISSFKYNGRLDKIASYKFLRFNDIKKIYYEPIFFKKGLIFFDRKGTIIKYNYNQKVIWRKNYYSKYEKKLGPKLNFSVENNNLIVADNVAKVFSLDINNGDLIWSINNRYPINSEIKIHKDKFFFIDFENTLKCYYLRNGSECWSVQTQKTFTISDSKNSLIINDNLVIFNNSIGDITAVDISTGFIEWQLPTQNNKIIDKTYNFEISQLVFDSNFLYFSNNKNQFYCVDIKNGIINWMNKINSSLSPVVIGEYIFTISNEGLLFTIQKNSGNIIRVNNIYNVYSEKKKKNHQTCRICCWR